MVINDQAYAIITICEMNSQKCADMHEMKYSISKKQNQVFYWYSGCCAIGARAKMLIFVIITNLVNVFSASIQLVFCSVVSYSTDMNI